MRLVRSRCCARAASGHAIVGAAEQGDELAPFHGLLPRAEDHADHGVYGVFRQALCSASKWGSHVGVWVMRPKRPERLSPAMAQWPSNRLLLLAK